MPGASGPCATSSSPVEQTATRGRGWHGTSLTSRLASTPRCAGVSSVPASNTRCPTSRSPPAGRTWSPTCAACRMSTLAPEDCVRSTITTASAPAGIGAPVMMRIASPGPTATAGATPAASSPTTCSVAGAWWGASAVSAARTAYPSIAVFANGGTISAAMTSRASTSPRASASATGRGSSGTTAPRMRLRASSSEITRALRQPASLDEVAHPFGQRRAEVFSVERELDVGVQEVELLPDVVAARTTTPREHSLLGEEQRDRVGELQLAALSRLDAVERVEDLGREHVAADHREVRGRDLSGRLLDDAANRHELAVGRAIGLDAAVRRDLVGRDLLHRDDRAPRLLVGREHRAAQRRVVDHEVVG